MSPVALFWPQVITRCSKIPLSIQNFLSSAAILRRTANCDSYFDVAMNAFAPDLANARLELCRFHNLARESSTMI